MQWLRNAFARRATRPTTPARPTAFRPTLETLDARDLPSVSSVLTAGGLTTFVVDSGNSLLVGLNGAAPTVQIQGTATTGVRTAQGFRTPAGNLGADIVFLDGTWKHIEVGTPGFLATTLGAKATGAGLTATDLNLTGRILDVGTAYDAQGRARLDIVVANTNTSGLQQKGQLFEFDQAPTALLGANTFGAITPLGTTVSFVSDYITPTGGTGFAFGQDFSTATTRANFTATRYLVRKFDSGTLSVLYDGSNFASSVITEYSQTVAPTAGATTIPGNILGIPATNTNPRTVITFTFNADTSLDAAFNPLKTSALVIDSGTNGVGGGINTFSLNGATTTIKPGA